jgi:hypothetical protein
MTMWEHEVHLWCIQLKRTTKSAAAMAGRAAGSSGALPTSAMLRCGRRWLSLLRGSSANSRHSLQHGIISLSKRKTARSPGDGLLPSWILAEVPMLQVVAQQTGGMAASMPEILTVNAGVAGSPLLLIRMRRLPWNEMRAMATCAFCVRCSGSI